MSAEAVVRRICLNEHEGVSCERAQRHDAARITLTMFTYPRRRPRGRNAPDAHPHQGHLGIFATGMADATLARLSPMVDCLAAVIAHRRSSVPAQGTKPETMPGKHGFETP